MSNPSYKFYQKIFPAPKEVHVVSKTFFNEIKLSTGYIELSKYKIETSHCIYEVRK